VRDADCARCHSATAKETMRARRTDSNHSEIVQTFRELGCSVLDLSRVGCGCPDILVARNGKMLLVEIKDGMKPPSARKLTPDEQRFHDTWKGPVMTCLDKCDAIKFAQILR
jgi:hypothetical protein